MSISMEQKLENILNADEPNYSDAAAELGSEAIPFLEKFIESEDPLIASKAAYLTSLIDDNRTISLLEKASKSEIVEVRIATAHGIKNTIANKKQQRTLQSDDQLAEVFNKDMESLYNILNSILKTDPEEDVRNAAHDTIESFNNN